MLTTYKHIQQADDGWKNSDFMIPDFDFMAMDDGTGYVGEFNQSQQD